MKYFLILKLDMSVNGTLGMVEKGWKISYLGG